jgi:hypothetical protein
MAQKMMWDTIGRNYRGQSSNGTVVTVAEDAMELAQKKAGKGVYESDWWIETLERVLEHWGIATKKWVDQATQTSRAGFTIGVEADANAPSPSSYSSMRSPAPAPAPPRQEQPQTRGSGPLLNRLSGGLNPKDVDNK